MNSKNYYVYALKDNLNIYRYVGNGRYFRFSDSSKRDRSAEYLQILSNGGKVVILHENLSKSEAIDLENCYLQFYLNNETLKFSLINKSASRLHSELKYSELCNIFEISIDSPTGLRWKIDRNKSKKKAGDIAGTRSNNGYASVMLNYKHYLCHRIIWVLYNKQNLCHEFVIDHIDRNNNNNLPENLRKVTAKQNNENRNINVRSNTGIVGISIISNGTKVKALVTHNGKKFEKNFSINKYGFENAIKLAEQWRLDKLNELQQFK